MSKAYSWVIELDPLDFFSLFSKRLLAKESYLKVDLSKGYLMSKDNSSFAILIYCKYFKEIKIINYKV